MPQHKRGPWSTQEDSYLVHLVGLHGAANWVRISAALQTRSPKQCRERFHQNLKPNLSHDPISAEEGVLIEQMVGEMGKRWAEIARRLRGRSDNAVKNWWNGGMNRRKRSNHSRRPDAEARQSSHMSAPDLPQHPTHHHTLPSSYAQSSGHSQQYYGQPVYQHTAPQHIHMPPNGQMYRQSTYIESPLPSPSAFSQLSTDAPSLVSDISSPSGRSSHHGPSPIELPPLSRSQTDLRYSGSSGLRLSVPGSLSEVDFSQPPMPTKHASHIFQEQYQQPNYQYHQQQPFPQPAHYLPSQPAEPLPSQQYYSHVMPPNPLLRGSYPPQFAQPTSMHPGAHHSLQLPSIADLAVSDTSFASPSMSMDPALNVVRTPGGPAAQLHEGSPRDKMSLSNLTH
ncbi:hypothetical protein LTR74_003449 [Friedmanniomyces endolithicus]|nr:hypothetical protein LTR74_003449 [Friedmanniomyces endolithicus]